jgi:hypothetical protein
MDVVLLATTSEVALPPGVALEIFLYIPLDQLHVLLQILMLEHNVLDLLVEMAAYLKRSL